MASSRPPPVQLQEMRLRDEATKLHVIVVGAGLGGMGTAIAIRLAGHDVTILESAPEIGEVGAGIQVLPNAARVLFSWGLEKPLAEYATRPQKCNFVGWRGNHLGEMDYHAYAKATGGQFWDFHRANLHKVLMDRAVELGATLITSAEVVDFSIADDDTLATVFLANGSTMTADLIVGADGINSKLRSKFVGKPDPPTLTGDLAYRLMIDTADMLPDPDLRPFVDNPQVNYWVGPGAHAVNYVLKGGKLFNMVLLVPDDLPPGSNIAPGDATEMRAHFEGWDPRLRKLTELCKTKEVLKWRLCIRPGLEPTWSHSSGAFTMMGDAVHATLPYLASGAGMALEDAGVLGICLGRMADKSPASKRKALEVYEACRRARTEEVVKRGSYNQWIYHLEDGPEQEARDERFAFYDQKDREWLSTEEPVLPRVEETGEDPFPWRRYGVGRWLLTYDMWKDVDEKWQTCCASEPLSVPSESQVRASL